MAWRVHGCTRSLFVIELKEMRRSNRSRGGQSLSSVLCEKLIWLLVVGGGGLEAEAAGEVDVEGVEGFLPSGGAGAEITASFV